MTDPYPTGTRETYSFSDVNFTGLLGLLGWLYGGRFPIDLQLPGPEWLVLLVVIFLVAIVVSWALFSRVD